MNDWDNNNVPPEEDDAFDWLSDDDDFSDSAEDDVPAWSSDDEAMSDDPHEWQMPHPQRMEEIESLMNDAEEADFGNEEELLDWMADIDNADNEREDDADAGDTFSWMSDETHQTDDADDAEMIHDELAWLADDDVSDLDAADAPTNDAIPEVDDDELAILNQLSQARTSDLDFMDGVTRPPSSDEQASSPPDVNTSELELLNELSQTPTGDLDFMEGVNRRKLDGEEINIPDLTDDELEQLNRLSASRTSDLSFVDDVVRDEHIPEVDDDELAILNQLSQARTSDLDFMEGVTRPPSSDEDSPAIPEVNTHELEVLNELSQTPTSDLDFMEGVSRPEDDRTDEGGFIPPEINTDEIYAIETLSRSSTDELDFMDGITRDNAGQDIPDIKDEYDILNDLDNVATNELDFMLDVMDDDIPDETIPADRHAAQAQEDEVYQRLLDVDNLATNELDFMQDVIQSADELDELAEQSDDVRDLQTIDRIATSEFNFMQDVIDEQEETEDSQKVTSGLLRQGSNIDFDVLNDNDPDWLDEISGIDTDTLDEVARETGTLKAVDIDTLIASFDADDDTPIDLSSAANLQSIFDQMDEEQRRQLPDDLPNEDLPAWLQEIAKGTDAESAAALVRQRRDRSLEELDDRLLDLRERGLELASDDEKDSERSIGLGSVAPHLNNALKPSQVSNPQATMATDLFMSEPQRQRAQLLSTLVGATVGANTVDTLSDSAPVASESLFKRVYARLDRVVISLLLIGAAVLPFVYQQFAQVGTLPPMAFEADSSQYRAFQLIDTLDTDQYVLVATEYGAAGARELDDSTRAFLEHVIVQGAIPVIVSSDTVGLLRAEQIVQDLLGEEAHNDRYYIAGYLPGGTIGLRDFASNVVDVIGSGADGIENGLMIDKLDDFGAIILISESGEVVRNWMEQIAPGTERPIIVAAGQAAYPLALPYVDTVDHAIALFRGYPDAYTYQQMAYSTFAPSPTPSPIVTNTLLATDVVSATATTLPQTSPTVFPVIRASATALSATSQTEVVSTATLVVTAAPTETAMPTLVPTLTPIPINTVTPDSSVVVTVTTSASNNSDNRLLDVGLVITQEVLEVRSGAGSNFDVIAEIDPGSRVIVQERSLDEQWVIVELPDGTTGWVEIGALQITQSTRDAFEQANTVTPIADQLIQVGTVSATGSVNVRAGAGTGFAVVDGLEAGTRVRILGISEDGAWYNIVLPSGQEGWIAEFLLFVEEIPASEWDGAKKNTAPRHYRLVPARHQQATPAPQDTVLIGRNAAGQSMPIYSDLERNAVLFEIANGAEFIILEEGPVLTQILSADGRTGYIETRVIVSSERARSEIDFAPTITPTPTHTPIPSVTPTPTATSFMPPITPAVATNPEARSSSQALGLMAAIVLIALGNLFWVFRWLGQRES